ncbi:hypothetical protein [uncultured Reyranella sp.]|jgi:hypothetical protein|uniref:hypothetical protein n=1 Tax=uncultured Reyranella sp. TaxID=735512 RepID=UPI00259CA065|nr:hypothetical protein [uncultured Reyranella sp.]
MVIAKCVLSRSDETGSLMLRDQTLFVVGAGASAEYQFPVGDQLKDDIARVLSRFPDETSAAVGQMAGAVAEYHHKMRGTCGPLGTKARSIAAALVHAPSIDQFVENHRHDPDVAILGKLAIAACLLDKEKSSPLFVDHRKSSVIDFQSVRHKWLGKLFQIIIDGQTLETLDTFFDHAAFVIFNYDRCVEHYFQYAISDYFGVSLERSRSIVDRCRIIHPYGTLGPWGDPQIKPSALAFGGTGPGLTISHSGLLRIAEENLRTYSEYIEDEREIALNRAALDSVQTVVFLGFAFHPQNVRLLQKIVPKKRSSAMATTYKVPEPAQAVISSDISTIMGVPSAVIAPTLANLECGQFLEDYRLLLMRR